MSKQKSGLNRGRGEDGEEPTLAVHQQIATILRQRILFGKYFKDGTLPGDLSLMEEFKVSRHTIRSALQGLVIDGLIERRRGLGTTIAPRAVMSDTWAIQSLDDLIGEFFKATVVFAGPVSASKNAEMADLFSVRKADSLYQVVRILRAESGPWAHSTIFTRSEYGSRIPKNLIARRVFVSLVEQYCGVMAARVRQSVTAVTPTADAQNALGIDANSPTLLLRRLFLTRSGEPITHVEMYCRPDRYAQVIELSRDTT